MDKILKDNVNYYEFIFKSYFGYLAYFLIVWVFQLSGLKFIGLIWFLFYLFFLLRGLYRFFRIPSDYSEENQSRHSNMALNETVFSLIGCFITGLGSYWLTFLVPGIWR
tara:strand:- start:54 stop:380 length:327 start_codon:yes stop_codon:yes gene_type:complete